MKNLKKLKISVCQMNIIPGRPDLNSKYITNEILTAAERGIDIIVFPEMCVTGYLIGDLWEDECFVKDVQFFNEQIREATKTGIASIFGSVAMRQDQKGEDGRIRKFNAALVAQNGQWIGLAFKSLHPNYRIFDDDRHFYSTRKIADENNEPGINNFLQPFILKTKIGEAYEFNGAVDESLSRFFECDGRRNGNVVITKILVPQIPSVEHQNRLAELLKFCKPIYHSVKRDNYAQFLEKELKIKISIISLGPKAIDKIEI